MWYASLRSENSKLLSYGWCQLGIAGAVFIAPIVLALSEATPNLENQTVVISILQMLYLGQLGATVIGATLFGQEYTNSALRTSLLAVPSRVVLLMAKLMVLFGIVIATGVVSSLLCLICLIFKCGLTPSSVLMSDLVRYIVPVIISGFELAVISAGLSVIMRSLVVPIAIMFSAVLGLSQMIFSVFEPIKVSPVLATMNLFLMPANDAFLPGDTGLLIQFAWAVVLFFIAGILFVRRDVR